MIDKQIADLTDYCRKSDLGDPTITNMPNGGKLITVPKVKLKSGWNRSETRVLFVAPPGYPGARPDCFWVEPSGLRLASGGTPQASNDANPIPGDVVPGRQTTWFSWHVQTWDPNRDNLTTYLMVIQQRLWPAR